MNTASAAIVVCGHPRPRETGVISTVTAMPGNTTGTARAVRPRENPTAASAVASVRRTAASTFAGSTALAGGSTRAGAGPSQMRWSVCNGAKRE